MFTECFHLHIFMPHRPFSQGELENEGFLEVDANISSKIFFELRFPNFFARTRTFFGVVTVVS